MGRGLSLQGTAHNWPFMFLLPYKRIPLCEKLTLAPRT